MLYFSITQVGGRIVKAKINMKRYFQVLGASLAGLLVIALVVLGFNFYNMDFSGEEGLMSEDIATVKASDGKVNVLAMGVDVDGLRTDAIMLVTYDTEANTVRALSIPRDTRMFIGSKYQKINAAHAISGSNGKPRGAQGTVEAVSRLTNVPINYYIEFSFSGIARCMDALGPVEFEIPDLNNDGVGMVYDDPVQDLHINLKPGLQELNGEQIVHLLRYRKGNKINGVRRTYKNGDIDRIAVQQDFVKALIDQKLNASLVLKIPSIFKQVSEEIKTNLTVKDVLKYSKHLSDLSSTDVEIYSLPGQFSGNEYNASYWICDLDATRELIETEFGYDASNITVDKSNAAKDKESNQSSSVTGEKTPKPSYDDDDEGVTTSKNNQTAKPSKTQTTKKDEDDENHVPEIKGDDEDTEEYSDEGQESSTPKPSSTSTPKPSSTQTPKPTGKPSENTGNSIPQKKEE